MCQIISSNIITKRVGEERKRRSTLFFSLICCDVRKNANLEKKTNSDFRRFFNTGIKIERCMTSLCEFFSLIGISNNTGWNVFTFVSFGKIIIIECFSEYSIDSMKNYIWKGEEKKMNDNISNPRRAYRAKKI